MEVTTKKALLLIGTVLAVVGVFLLPPVPQSLAFHHFADTRSLWSIANFGNVVSNVPFLFVAVMGFLSLRGSTAAIGLRLIYAVLFTGVLLTGIGSTYYHLNPNNDTFVWDRIPMTIVFMSLFAAVVSQMVSYRLGVSLLLPLLVIGIDSVLWWHWTEGQGHGDLRLYGLVQFYPGVFIPLILWLFYTPAYKPMVRALVWVVVWYAIAKLLEAADYPIYNTIGISGHTLKHVAAAVSVWGVVGMVNNNFDPKVNKTVPK